MELHVDLKLNNRQVMCLLAGYRSLVSYWERLRLKPLNLPHVMHGNVGEALGKCSGVEEDIGLQLSWYLSAVDLLERSALWWQQTGERYNTVKRSRRNLWLHSASGKSQHRIGSCQVNAMQIKVQRNEFLTCCRILYAQHREGVPRNGQQQGGNSVRQVQHQKFCIVNHQSLRNKQRQIS